MKPLSPGIPASLAAAAAFAMLSAYLGLRYMNARTDASLARQDAEVAQVEIRGLQQRLEAERIISQHQIEALNSAGGVGQLKISKLQSGTAPDGMVYGVAVWNPATQNGVLVTDKTPAAGPEKSLQVWLTDRATGNSISAGVVEAGAANRIEFRPVQPVSDASEIRITEEKKGGVARSKGAVIASGAF